MKTIISRSVEGKDKYAVSVGLGVIDLFGSNCLLCLNKFSSNQKQFSTSTDQNTFGLFIFIDVNVIKAVPCCDFVTKVAFMHIYVYI